MYAGDASIMVFFISWLVSGYCAFKVFIDGKKLRDAVKKADREINVALFMFDKSEKRYYLSHLKKSFITFFKSFATFGSKEIIEQELTCYIEVAKVKTIKDKEIHAMYDGFVAANSFFIRSLTVSLTSSVVLVLLTSLNVV